MRVLLAIFLFLSYTDRVSSQETIRMYRPDELQASDPDTVLGLDLSGMKLDRVPDSILVFTNLKYLDLSRNKLNTLPEFIDSLKTLETLDISRNRIDVFPLVITRLQALKVLKANRNDFDRLPDAIRYNTSLEFIDLWDTPVGIYPDGFYTLKSLRKVDLSGIRFGPTFQKALQERMPWVDFVMDEPCDCME